jgi:hypothetical protein
MPVPRSVLLIHEKAFLSRRFSINVSLSWRGLASDLSSLTSSKIAELSKDAR